MLKERTTITAQSCAALLSRETEMRYENPVADLGARLRRVFEMVQVVVEMVVVEMVVVEMSF